MKHLLRSLDSESKDGKAMRIQPMVIVDGLGPVGLGSRSNNPFHFRGSQESKPPGPKPPNYH